jgi:RNA polymerase sigma factor for flagellar operon FliA
MDAMLEGTRDEVICRNLPLVRQVALRFHVGASSPIEMNDLVQLGVIGLIDATEKFDASKGTSFQSYARFRIKGSILDGLRHLDFLPRSVRRRRRELQEATQRVEQRLGGAASEEDIAEAMDLEPEELRTLLGKVQAASLTSVEEMAERGCEAELNRALVDGSDDGPAASVEKAELKSILREAIESLPEKEAVVLSLYYYEELTMREVGDVLGVTESRVSQLHSKALGRLRCRLASEVARSN